MSLYFLLIILFSSLYIVRFDLLSNLSIIKSSILCVIFFSFFIVSYCSIVILFNWNYLVYFSLYCLLFRFQFWALFHVQSDFSRSFCPCLLAISRCIIVLINTAIVFAHSAAPSHFHYCRFEVILLTLEPDVGKGKVFHQCEFWSISIHRYHRSPVRHLGRHPVGISFLYFWISQYIFCLFFSLLLLFSLSVYLSVVPIFFLNPACSLNKYKFRLSVVVNYFHKTFIKLKEDTYMPIILEICRITFLYIRIIIAISQPDGITPSMKHFIWFVLILLLFFVFRFLVDVSCRVFVALLDFYKWVL